MAARRWVGIDQGFSQMGLAILGPGGDVLASEKTREPGGDGHDREVALARLRTLLARVEAWRDVPVHLAGYCYEQSGVAQAFAAAGWRVAGTKGLNDVLGVYGLTAMRGNVVVAGCGTYSQVVYVDDHQAVRWPGDDVAERLPEWLLSGRAYSGLIAERARQGADPAMGDLRAAVREMLGAAPVETAPHAWNALGRLLPGLLDDPGTRAFLTRAAAAVLATRDVLWGHSGAARPPEVALGGGAVRDDRLWAPLAGLLAAQGATVARVEGDPAVGLARFALAHPEADAWAVIGLRRPAWLS